MNCIERTGHMQRLLDLMGNPDIKINTGIRHSRKSELMKYVRRITETQADANINCIDIDPDTLYELEAINSSGVA